MNLLIPLIFILLLSITYVACQENNTNRLVSLLVVMLIIFVFCYFQLTEEINRSHPTSYSGLKDFLSPHEGFYGGAPIGHTMGPCAGLAHLEDIERRDKKYDGLLFKHQGVTKPDYSILPSDKVAYHSPVGDAYSLNPDAAYTQDYPTVDGGSNSPKHLFMFAYNKSSPECCPSTYSSSRGCVCMSQAQRDFINKRGMNKTSNGNPDF